MPPDSAGSGQQDRISNSAADRLSDYWWEQRRADAAWAAGAEEALRRDTEREWMERADAD